MRTRRPLIEEYRRAYGLPATVHELTTQVRDLQLADRTGDVVQNIYPSGGGGGGGGGGVSDHGALTGLADIDHPTDLYDALVDSGDPRVGTQNVYATLQAAITAGHESIWFRTSTDAADITINAEDVTRVTGDTATTANVPVNITCNKVAVLFEALGFAGKSLTLAGAQDRAFACLFSGSITLGTALANGSVAVDDVSMPFDAGTNGGLATWGAKGYARIDSEYISWNAGGAAVSGTITGGQCKGFFDTLDVTHADNATITAIDKGSLNIIGTDCGVTACYFVGCTNVDAQCIYIDSSANGANITACSFLSNTTFSCIAVANRDPAVTAYPKGIQIVGCKFAGNDTIDGLISVWERAGASGDSGIRGGSINGCYFGTFPAGAVSGMMGAWNISGNTFDGQYAATGAKATDAYRINDATGINTTDTTIDYDTKTGNGDLPSKGIVDIEGEMIAYSNKTATQLLNCIRGFNGSPAASHADNAVITPINWIAVKLRAGNSNMTGWPNVIGGCVISSRVHVFMQLYRCDNVAGNNSPTIINGCSLSSGILYMGSAMLVSGNAANGCTIDVRNNGQGSVIALNTNGTSQPFGILNADQYLVVFQPQYTVTEATGVNSQTRFPDTREIAFGVAAGDRVPGCIPLVNRSGGATVLGHIVILDVANDYSFTTIAGAASVLRCGVVVEAGVANTSTALVATMDGTECEILCNGTVNRGEYLETSATAGEARSTGSTTKGNTSVARALQARAGAGSSLIRCVIEK